MGFLIILISLISLSKAFEVYPPVTDSNSTKQQDIYFVFMQSVTGLAFNASGTIPAIQIALDLINNDTSILNGYTLHYVLGDSQCDHTVALKSFFDMILNEPTKLAIVGGGCSVATEPVAEIAHYYNITQISCLSSSSRLVDRTRYKSYFQLWPTETGIAPIIVAACREYGWRQISIIVQDENLFTINAKALQNILQAYNISWTDRKFRSESGVLSLGDELFGENERIYYLAMYDLDAQVFICEAWKRGFIYPRYTYITNGWYSEHWWKLGNHISCTTEQMEATLEYSLVISQRPVTKNNKMPTYPTGITQYEFDKMYAKNAERFGYDYYSFAEMCFDAVMTMAIALNRTDDGTPISNFTYKDNHMKDKMFEYLTETNFLGLTWNVDFDSNGIRTSTHLRILQYRKDAGKSFDLVQIGTVTSNDIDLYLTANKTIDVWPDGVPFDGIPDEEIVSIHIGITIIYSILALAGIAFTLFCFIFNVCFRKQKFMKLSSPNLNYFILTGALILYVSIIGFIIPAYSEDTESILCNIRPRVFSIGYSLCFGTILAKMWRVYYIFNNPNLKKKAMKDWHLVVFVLVVVTIDLLLIGLLAIYEGGRVKASLIRKKESPSFMLTGIHEYKTDYYTYVCDSTDRDIWLGIVYGYKALLQLAALFLAFATRKVTMKGLNDSFYTTIIIYFTSVIVTVAMIASISLNEFVNTYSSLLATCVFVMSTVILSLTFIPKVYNIYKDPNGDRVLPRNTNSIISSIPATGTMPITIVDTNRRESMRT